MKSKAMSCEEVIERLFDYLDRELDPQEATDVERHLHRCRDCFTRAEFERRLRARVTATGTAKAPPRLHQRIRTLLDRFDESDTTR
ncbi:anti-sigma factor [Halomonas sp. MCCC 1A17488]|uniref:Anti-sigma factor n=1 Tax=Billgrantia sulfidoxydans TaxID=2733484 RepID=A0ABX7W8B6_9GAMM|nr:MULTISPECIES: zf-HC2 domain-containing protein [Halomonas]MCE8018001.1 anti-sigma factor [Halomonas sp. MCCC 1A17488]MCG3241334.1 anti-sigma factor [Halomonas sp. MCCC 1A17488]QPP48702.1 zf-HC2 domain-containing protein [Halomonas sp. SS10-MC5]QTP56040.1 anti-sigma factor [Halomonas sulfidoxydans]